MTFRDSFIRVLVNFQWSFFYFYFFDLSGDYDLNFRFIKMRFRFKFLFNWIKEANIWGPDLIFCFIFYLLIAGWRF
jgi:hypothetical protein